LWGAGGAAEAGVYFSSSEALELAFPEADRIERKSLVVSDPQAAAIESLARAPLESRLVTIYTGVKDEEILGYAFIDIHTVRTMPEAFLIVISPEGQVDTLRVLAFYEPEEYLPPDRWLGQFDYRTLEETLRVGGGIHGIAGSTLSARAVTGGVRRSLALFEVLVKQAKQTPTGSEVAVDAKPSHPGQPDLLGDADRIAGEAPAGSGR
jgi:hypothetical protein